MRQLVVVAAIMLAGCQTDGGGGPVASSAPPPVPSTDKEKTPGYVRPNDGQAIAAAKQMASGKLKDPDSAKFADVTRKTIPNLRGEPTDVVCGKLNAKNSYGGYTGAKPFVYFVADKSSVFAEDDVVGPEVVRSFCPEMLR